MGVQALLGRLVRRVARPAHDEVRELILELNQQRHAQGESLRELILGLDHQRRAEAHQLQGELGTQLAELNRALDRLAHEASPASEAALELSVYVGRALREVRDALARLRLGLRIHGRVLSGRTGEQPILADLDADSADFLNFAQGHLGFAAESGLWVNHPVVIGYEPGRVIVSDVNERIVEFPYALRALAGLPRGASVLDVGATESTLALSLASLGYAVTALDCRRYPFAHPRLEVAVSRLEDWDAGGRVFDALIALSSIEHFGLGVYGESPGSQDADLEAMTRLRELANDGALLLLTVPFGDRFEVTQTQRVYDEERLGRLLDGWSITDRVVAEQLSQSVWLARGATPGREPVSRIVMITARAS